MRKGFKYFIIRSIIFLAVIYLIFPLLIKGLAAYLGSGSIFETNLFLDVFALVVIGAFVVLRRNELINLKTYKFGFSSVIYFFLSVIFIGLFTYSKYSWNLMHVLNNQILVVSLTYLFYFLAALFLAFGVYSQKFMYDFREELGSTALIIALFFMLFKAMSDAWYFLGVFISKATYYLLSIHSNAMLSLNNGISLGANNFEVIIGSPCSGIASIGMFLGLFLFISFLDYGRLKTKFILKYLVIGLIGLIIVVILRLYILMVIGAYFSEKLALGLFHDNLSWILFIIYLIGYWYIVYPNLFGKRE